MHAGQKSQWNCRQTEIQMSGLLNIVDYKRGFVSSQLVKKWGIPRPTIGLVGIAGTVRPVNCREIPFDYDADNRGPDDSIMGGQVPLCKSV